MKILCTGSEGLVGSHLVSELRGQGHGVYRFDIAYQIDLDIEKSENVKTIVEAGDFDLIIHLAALLDRNAPLSDLINTNVLGTANVLEAANGIPTLVMSSAAALHPKEDPYGLSKKLMEDVCDHFENVSIMRLANVYSNQLNRRDVISQFLTACKEGKTIQIHGDGNQQREFIPVSYVVEEILDWIKLDKQSDRNRTILGPALNRIQVSGNQAFPINQVAQLVQTYWRQHANIPPPLIEFVDKDKGVHVGVIGINKEHGWRTHINYETYFPDDLERIIKELAND